MKHPVDELVWPKAIICKGEAASPIGEGASQDLWSEDQVSYIAINAFNLGVAKEMERNMLAPNTSLSKHDYPACALFRGGKCTCDESTDVKTANYEDGTTAIGMSSLPKDSPKE